MKNCLCFLHIKAISTCIVVHVIKVKMSAILLEAEISANQMPGMLRQHECQVISQLLVAVEYRNVIYNPLPQRQINLESPFKVLLVHPCKIISFNLSKTSNQHKQRQNLTLDAKVGNSQNSKQEKIRKYFTQGNCK